jgi:hypothetical protein
VNILTGCIMLEKKNIAQFHNKKTELEILFDFLLLIAISIFFAALKTNNSS